MITLFRSNTVSSTAASQPEFFIVLKMSDDSNNQVLAQQSEQNHNVYSTPGICLVSNPFTSVLTAPDHKK